MNLPGRHEFRLSIPGLPELQEMLRNFVEHALRFAEFDEAALTELAAAVCSAVRLVEAEIEKDGDVDLPITVAAMVDGAAIEFSILEQGRPLGDDAALGTRADIPDRIRPAAAFDRAWWIHRGPEGSELHLRRARPHAEISTLVAVAQRLQIEAHEFEEQPAAPDTEYQFRPFREQDALDVARCIYEAYGYTYPNPDLFYPDRIAALNRDGRLRSFVAETKQGAVVGHYGLERPELGPIGEAGQAVIDHAHRGKGLMQSMRAVVEEDGRRIGLLGIWSQPTARHPFSQKMNLAFGSVPCGLSLSTTPATTVLRGGAVVNASSDRHSCFLYWHSLTAERPLRASVPESLVSLLAALYEARRREASFDTRLTPPDKNQGGCDVVHAVFDRTRGVGRIAVDRIGSESLTVIREAVRMLQEVAAAEALFIDLPIDDPACAFLATGLIEDGFLFAGIGPRFHCRPGDSEDTLRLQKPLAAFDRNAIVAEGELGKRLMEFILASLPLSKK